MYVKYLDQYSILGSIRNDGLIHFRSLGKEVKREKEARKMKKKGEFGERKVAKTALNRDQKMEQENG